MLETKKRKISRKIAKRDLSLVGLVLILYSLFVLFLPYGVKYFLSAYDPHFFDDEYIFIGIELLLLVFGTSIPFFLLKCIAKVKSDRLFVLAKANFIDLFVQTIICIGLCIGLTYISNLILGYFELTSSLLTSIGLVYEEAYMDNILYIFLFIVVTPIIEEYAFRGVLINALGKYGKSFALTTSSIIFALAHGNLGECLPAYVMGKVLGKISLRYKSIQPPIFIHILFNGFLYALCVIPDNISKYLAYGIAAVCMLAFYLVLTGRYRSVRMKKSNNKVTSLYLFFTRFTVILSILLMIGHIWMMYAL